MLIKYIKNPTEAVQLKAVESRGLCIKYIENPTEAVQLKVVSNIGHYIKHIKNPSEAVKIAAVGQNGYSLRCIQDPSEELKILGIKQTGCAIQFIENPSEELKMLAARQDGHSILYIENPSEAVKMLAVEQDGTSIQFIENPSESLKIAAVRQDSSAIQFIENPSDDVKFEATSKNGNNMGISNVGGTMSLLLGFNDKARTKIITNMLRYENTKHFNPTIIYVIQQDTIEESLKCIFEPYDSTIFMGNFDYDKALCDMKESGKFIVKMINGVYLEVVYKVPGITSTPSYLSDIVEACSGEVIFVIHEYNMDNGGINDLGKNACEMRDLSIAKNIPVIMNVEYGNTEPDLYNMTDTYNKFRYLYHSAIELADVVTDVSEDDFVTIRHR